MSDNFDIGYTVKAPCDVCGILADTNQQEPRFLYVVCREHRNVNPLKIEQLRKELKGESHE